MNDQAAFNLNTRRSAGGKRLLTEEEVAQVVSLFNKHMQDFSRHNRHFLTMDREFWDATDPDAEDDRTVSKIGGHPFWPAGAPYDVDKQLALLAQINFSELPDGSTAALNTPADGILQFFISTKEGFGRGKTMDEGGYLVKHWTGETVREAEAENGGLLEEGKLRPLDDETHYMFFIGERAEPMRLRFAEEVQVGTVSPEDNVDFLTTLLNRVQNELPEVFDTLFGNQKREHEDAKQGGKVAAGSEESKLDVLQRSKADFDALSLSVFPRLVGNGMNTRASYLGGQPMFCECEDPRTSWSAEDSARASEPFHLLLQIDQDDGGGLVIGDYGSIQFFIRDQDLKDQKWDRVRYFYSGVGLD